MEVSITGDGVTTSRWLSLDPVYEGEARVNLVNPEGVIKGRATAMLDAKGKLAVEVTVAEIEAAAEDMKV